MPDLVGVDRDVLVAAGRDVERRGWTHPVAVAKSLGLDHAVTVKQMRRPAQDGVLVAADGASVTYRLTPVGAELYQRYSEAPIVQATRAASRFIRAAVLVAIGAVAGAVATYFLTR